MLRRFTFYKLDMTNRQPFDAKTHRLNVLSELGKRVGKSETIRSLRRAFI
jgi:hypothetical protein